MSLVKYKVSSFADTVPDSIHSMSADGHKMPYLEDNMSDLGNKLPGGTY